MDMIEGVRLRQAVVFALFNWALLVLIQIENFNSSILPSAEGKIRACLLFLANLPLLQAENIAVSLAVGLGTYFFARRFWMRIIWLALFVIAAVCLLADQVYFSVFSDHFRISAMEGAGTALNSMLLSSIGAVLNAAFYFNAAVVASGAVFLGFYFLRKPDAPPARWHRRHTAAALGVALIFIAGLPALFTNKYQGIPNHPFFVLCADLFQDRVIHAVTRRENASPKDGSGKPPLDSAARTDHDGRMADLLKANLAAHPSPNVILIVLESVGSKQILEGDGLPLQGDTPNIARLCEHGMIFDSVYTLFPATARSHVALNTGGRTLTWGNVFEMFEYPYVGPTLPRCFSEQGYQTAVYSGGRLDYENMLHLYQNLGYGSLYEFGGDKDHQTLDYTLDSWGAKEDYTVFNIEHWIDRAVAAKAPFFVNYITIATHHPYVCPPDFVRPFHGTTNFLRYLNALYYTDNAIGKLVDFLKSRQLLDNTVIAITGDHGEAFGDLHPGNFTHKNRLFEENIKSFLILIPPVPASAPIVSHRIASMGDIMPTLLAFLGTPAPDVPGKSLLSEDYREHPVFFHKNAFPEQWGLRDGRWKYISNIRDESAELYDLDSDPVERYNLAGQNDQRIRLYEQMCGQWYMRSDDEFAARLKNYHYGENRPASPAQLREEGPSALSVGHTEPGEAKQFVEQNVVNPDAPVESRARWVAYGKDTPIQYDWISPSGKIFSTTFTIKTGWVVSYLDYPGPIPMEQGSWRLVLHAPGRNTELISAKFTVDPKATPPAAASAE